LAGQQEHPFARRGEGAAVFRAAGNVGLTLRQAGIGITELVRVQAGRSGLVGNFCGGRTTGRSS